jgi:hypothetical protein
LQCSYSVEYESESVVEPRLQLRDPLHEIGVLAVEAPKANERAHDLNVDCHGPWAAQNTGEHRDALFCERAGCGSTPAASGGL